MTGENFLFTQHNYEAETQIIGSVFLEPDLINDLIMSPDHFFDGKLRKCFSWMRALQKAGETIDIVTIVEVAQDRITEIGGITYLTDIIGSVPTTANIKHNEQIVINHWKERAKKKVYQAAISSGETDEQVQEKIKSITETGVRRARFSMKDQLVHTYDKVENMTGGLAGATTGFHELDLMLEGLEKEKLIIVAARPSVGKTAFAINISSNAIRKSLGKEEEVFSNIFSLEMGTDQLTNRMLSEAGNVDGRKVKNPKEYFNDDDWAKYTNAMSELSMWEDNIDICDDFNMTVEQIRARVRENKKDHPDKHHIVVIDYLQLIQASTNYNGNRQQEISEISRQLKSMTKELNCTVIALSQLSRGVEARQDKRPMLSDLRESGAIEQDADIISFLYRDDYYDKESENKNIIEIIIAKNREGSTGTVSLAYIKEYSKFVNLERRFDEAS